MLYISAFIPVFSLKIVNSYMQWIYPYFYSEKSCYFPGQELPEENQLQSNTIKARFYKFINTVITLLCSKSYEVNAWSARFHYAVNTPLNQKEIPEWIKEAGFFYNTN